MKKRYLFGGLLIALLVLFFTSVLYSMDRNEEKRNPKVPRIGQKLWTYNMNKHEWRKYSKNDDETSKDEIILQLQYPEGNGSYTNYYLHTGNAQVPKENVYIGESSYEFLNGKDLLSYYPKHFEYHNVIFNGVKFVPYKLNEEDVQKIFKDFQIIKVSELQKGTLNLKINKNKKYMILNDVGEDFYKYYVVPNDSSKLKIGEYSNMFEVSDNLTVKIQRLEGCSKAYPCYEINIK